MPLALDYRPANLSEFEGNEELKKSLSSVLKRKQKDIPHCFLFHGLSGGGKTTLALIVAATLKCSKFELTEVNSAHFNGVDHVRELERTIRHSPMDGNCRVWIFNECHKWTDGAQNAMLDMMEEKMPDHAYFILTTTDPHKLVKPLRKRCLEYEVLPLKKKEMMDFLVGVVEDEKADVPDSILEKIVKAAGGSSRNALQMLEKVIDLSPEDMKNADITLEDEETVIKDLIDALIKRQSWKEVAPIIKSLKAEPETIRRSILGYAEAILLSGKDSKQAALIMDCFSKNTFDTGRAGITLAAYEAVL